MDEDDRTTFEQYAESWLTRQTHYKPSTLAGYKRQLEVVYPYIGGVTLNKLRPLILEEMWAELRKRKNRRGEPVCEATVHKYLETVSAVLEDAKRNDILLYNPAHRVRGIRSGTAAGGRGEIFRRGRCAGFQHTGGRKAVDVA